MPDLQRVALSTVAAAPLPCRTATHTCVACCRGRRVPERSLAAALRRQTRLFARVAPGPAVPSRVTLLWYELRVRRGLDVLLAGLLLLPGVGAVARRWFADRMHCAFLGFDGPAGDRAGCLLHPSKWDGVDVRRAAAFVMIPGMGCGNADHVCRSALLYRAAPWAARRRFQSGTDGLGWFAYSSAVEGLEDELLPNRRPTAVSGR